jgi:hypothetical protein
MYSTTVTSRSMPIITIGTIQLRRTEEVYPAL